MSRIIKKIEEKNREGILIRDYGENRTTILTRSPGGIEITIDQHSGLDESQTIHLLEDDLLEFFNLIIIPAEEVLKGKE